MIPISILQKSNYFLHTYFDIKVQCANGTKYALKIHFEKLKNLCFLQKLKSKNEQVLSSTYMKWVFQGCWSLYVNVCGLG